MEFFIEKNTYIINLDMKSMVPKNFKSSKDCVHKINNSLIKLATLSNENYFDLKNITSKTLMKSFLCTSVKDALIKAYLFMSNSSS